MADASFTDILRDRTHKYRRTLIAVCLIIITVYILIDIVPLTKEPLRGSGEKMDLGV
jgi:hypothetical protein